MPSASPPPSPPPATLRLSTIIALEHTLLQRARSTRCLSSRHAFWHTAAGRGCQEWPSAVISLEQGGGNDIEHIRLDWLQLLFGCPVGVDGGVGLSVELLLHLACVRVPRSGLSCDNAVFTWNRGGGY